MQQQKINRKQKMGKSAARIKTEKKNSLQQ